MSQAAVMKELYHFDYTHMLQTTFRGIPTIESRGRMSVEIRALLPKDRVGFVNMRLTKKLGHAGSVRVMANR